jgi:hypothetical protein
MVSFSNRDCQSERASNSDLCPGAFCATPLSDEDRRALEDLERVVTSPKVSNADRGAALEAIRASSLHREHDAEFFRYAYGRFGIGGMTAQRLLRAGAVENLRQTNQIVEPLFDEIASPRFRAAPPIARRAIVTKLRELIELIEASLSSATASSAIGA